MSKIASRESQKDIHDTLNMGRDIASESSLKSSERTQNPSEMSPTESDFAMNEDKSNHESLKTKNQNEIICSVLLQRNRIRTNKLFDPVAYPFVAASSSPAALFAASQKQSIQDIMINEYASLYNLKFAKEAGILSVCPEVPEFAINKYPTSAAAATERLRFQNDLGLMAHKSHTLLITDSHAASSTSPSNALVAVAPGALTARHLADQAPREAALPMMAALDLPPPERTSDSQHAAAGAQVPAARRGDARANEDMRLMIRPKSRRIVPEAVWHAPWRLRRVISGHTGWVRCVDVDVSNEWFATGGGDRLIKIWDLASGELRLSLTGHVASVRQLAVSARHPYLFSAGEDKMVKCWDLEVNRVVRTYHGHLSAVFALALHPQLDLIATGGRDAAVRVWDVRTRACAFVLPGHQETIAALGMQAQEYQMISTSLDSTVRLWDLRQGRSSVTLTHHKKGVRALALGSRASQGPTFATASAGRIKQWAMLPRKAGSVSGSQVSEYPDVRYVQDFQGHDAVINGLALSGEGVLASGGDDGTMSFWDWRSARCFQRVRSKVQPGSLEAEAGIFALAFDQTGSRLISCEADKTVKIWGEDPNATPETHPAASTSANGGSNPYSSRGAESDDDDDDNNHGSIY